MPDFIIKRTVTAHPDFQQLVFLLDKELWEELKEDQATYEQYNEVTDIKTAVLVYVDNKVVACGCFKPFNATTVEIKRMFVDKVYRGKGVSKIVLHQLEQWAKEKGFKEAVLETSVHFATAINLYKINGYKVIPNYAQYAGLEESVCMKKILRH